MSGKDVVTPPEALEERVQQGPNTGNETISATTQNVHYKSLDDLAKEVGLTKVQVMNYQGYMRSSGLTTGHTRKNPMSYTPEELQILQRMGKLKDAMGVVQAFFQAVGEVLGEPKKSQLIEWRKKRIKESSSKQTMRRLAEITHLAAKTGYGRTLKHLHPGTKFTLLSNNNKQVRTMAGKQLLEHLVSLWPGSEEYVQVTSYPINVYLAIIGNKPKPKSKIKHVAKRVIDAAMRLTPPVGDFESYTAEVYSKVTQFWNIVSQYVRQPLDTAQAETLEQLTKIAEKGYYAVDTVERRKLRKGLNALGVIKFRYGSNSVFALKETGVNFGVTGETVRNREEKGMGILRRHQLVRKLLQTDVLGECIQRLEESYGKHDRHTA